MSRMTYGLFVFKKIRSVDDNAAVVNYCTSMPFGTRLQSRRDSTLGYNFIIGLHTVSIQ